MTSTSIISNSVSKDALMKNLFKFPKETLLFVKEVVKSTNRYLKILLLLVFSFVSTYEVVQVIF